MENFVDRIIETDRKAREIIDAAKKEQACILREAEDEARSKLAVREAQNKKEMDAIDAEYAAKVQKQTQQSDAQYIEAKRALDAAFEKGRKVWLQEITDGVLAAQ